MRVRSAVSMTLVAAGMLASGCASGPPPATTADLARAHTLVASAERSGAQQYAAADLQKARDEAQQADELASQGKPERADQLANEAALDAQLASARAGDGTAQHDLAALDQSLEALRREEERNAGAPGAAPPAPYPNTPPPAAPSANPPSPNPPQ